ncbi:MAG: hypothetical protein QM612_07390 [Thermomonas sp.]|uniref:hypothetical protein n=1 Tax=Thermomonas sp. TaxID=1971895 RepID=UPI0039E2D919
MSAALEQPTRKVGILLFIGILFLPYIFVWFLLRKGHSTLARTLGFGWLLLLFWLVSGKSPDPTTRAQTQHTSAQQQEAALAALRTELDGNRDGILRDIQALMEKQDFQAAQQQAARYGELHDAQIDALAQQASAKLEALQAAQRAEADKHAAAALQSLSKKTDKIEGVDWYRDKSSPAYNNQNGFYLYIGKKAESNPWLRLRIQYYSDDWLFIRSIIVVADGQRFEKNGLDFERDHDSHIWEWYDANPTAEDLRMIEAVIASKDATIRFVGQQYHNDKKITASQKAALRRVLDAYKALGGT